MNDEQREGLGEALVDSLVEVWQSDDTVVIHADQIDPAIDAIAEYLWQRADDPEVVEAVVLSGMLFPERHDEHHFIHERRLAAGYIHRVLTALIGPRPAEQENE